MMTGNASSKPTLAKQAASRHIVAMDVVEIVCTAAGAGLRALRDIPNGTFALRFEGPVVPWAEVPPGEVRYVVMHASGDWVIPNPPGRFINHSCEPNLRFTEPGEMVAIRDVSAGEELTASYDMLQPFDVERRRDHPDWYFWDDRWSFDCACASARCRGRIDRYVSPGEG